MINLRIAVAVSLFVSPLLLAAPDEELLGKSKGYPIGNRTSWFYDETVRVGSFTNLDKIFPYHVIGKSTAPRALRKAATEPAFRYQFQDRSYSVDDYLEHQRVTGLLILKDGEILVERYQYGRAPSNKFISNSMAKSITSLLVGFALAEGKIRSLDDTIATYAPELKGCAYGETTIRNILRMGSGVKFREAYDGEDDLVRFGKLAYYRGIKIALCDFNEREAPPGTRFHYASSETMVLAVLLQAVLGTTLSDYVHKKIWEPMGAESDATWAIDERGLEHAAGNFNATLRDWGRFGTLLAYDGAIGDRQILPKDYLIEATDWHRHPEGFAPKRATPGAGYGYQFWISPAEKRRFFLVGVYGQAIYVDPELKLVMVHLAAAKNASVGKETMGAERSALWVSLVNHYGKW